MAVHNISHAKSACHMSKSYTHVLPLDLNAFKGTTLRAATAHVEFADTRKHNARHVAGNVKVKSWLKARIILSHRIFQVSIGCRLTEDCKAFHLVRADVSFQLACFWLIAGVLKGTLATTLRGLASGGWVAVSIARISHHARMSWNAKLCPLSQDSVGSQRPYSRLQMGLMGDALG